MGRIPSGEEELEVQALYFSLGFLLSAGTGLSVVLAILAGDRAVIVLAAVFLLFVIAFPLLAKMAVRKS